MARTTEITNSEDVIDSRSVISRIEELESEREALEDDQNEADSEFDSLEAELADAEANDETENGADNSELEAKVEAARSKLEEATENLKEWDDSEEATELKNLKALADEAEGYAPDWIHGTTLIRDSYFDGDYARQECEDMGMIPKDFPAWISVDWDATAETMKVDYTTVDFDGVEYLIR